MSRVSQKSSLSPSVTRGSSAIDLGKDSGVDMGRKAQPSVTSGGIGITQEVTNVGGVSVSAGVNVDITPVDFGINVNPSEGTVSVATGAEIPGGLLGVSGGIEIDTNTGQVIGGSLGAEVGGFGINVSNSQKGGLGIEFTVQIPGTPIELSLGFGFPSPPRTKNPPPFSPPPPGPFPPPPLPSTGGGNSNCTVIVAIRDNVWVVWDEGYGPDEYSFFAATGSVQADNGFQRISSSFTYRSNFFPDIYSSPVQTFSPNWRQTRFSYDLFTFSQSYLSTEIVGVSGQESEVYKALNDRCHAYYVVR